MSQQPSRCRIVEYKIGPEDATRINRRRTRPVEIKEAIDAGRWPKGAQAHVGIEVQAGDVFPMVITRVTPDEPALPLVNGQVLLDGNDTYWVTAAVEGSEPGTWNWPPRV